MNGGLHADSVVQDRLSGIKSGGFKGGGQLSAEELKRERLKNKMKLPIENVRKTDRNVVVPKQLVAKIEQFFVDSFRRQHPLPEGTAPKPTTEILREMKRQYLYLDVIFDDSGKGVLTRSVQYALPRGGGKIDLADVVNPSRAGTFNSYFRWQHSLLPAEALEKQKEGQAPGESKVFFVSRARRRKLGSKVYGSGCNQFHDVSDFFQLNLKQYPLELSTLGYSYASVLGGTFVFVHVEKDNLFLGTLTMTDSRFPHLFCESA